MCAKRTFEQSLRYSKANRECCSTPELSVLRCALAEMFLSHHSMFACLLDQTEDPIANACLNVLPRACICTMGDELQQ